jgi:CRISPR-associated protein Cas2
VSARLILVAYDVSDDKRRVRLAKALARYGDRVQYSVFACRLAPAQVDRMRRDVAREVDPSEDSVRFYEVCAACLPRAVAFGRTRLPAAPRAVIL